MKYILIFMIVLITGCNSLPKQMQENAVVESASCGGNSAWLECYKEAATSCPNGFEVLQKEEDMRRGVRQLSFTCKN